MEYECIDLPLVPERYVPSKQGSSFVVKLSADMEQSKVFIGRLTLVSNPLVLDKIDVIYGQTELERNPEERGVRRHGSGAA